MASHANLHVGSLPDGIDEALFRSLFEGCGSIVSTKLFADRGFGFVKMSSMEEAQRAIEVVNRATVLGSTLTVKLAAHDGTKGHAKGDGGSGKAAGGRGKDGWSGGKDAWSGGWGGDELQSLPCEQVWVGGLPLDITNELLAERFGKYCRVRWSKVLPAAAGSPDAAALLQTGAPEEAQWLVEHLNGNIPAGLSAPIAVKFAKARPPGERRGAGERPGPYGAPAREAPGRHAPGADLSNLYVRGLPSHADELFLYKLFAPFGALEGVKAVVQEHHGHEDAIAYVKFAVASDAAAAIEALNETTLPDGCLINVHVKRPSAKGKGKG